MRIVIPILFTLVFFGCSYEKGDDGKLLFELEDHYAEIAAESIHKLEQVYVWGHEIQLRNVYESDGHTNLKLLNMLSKIDSMHALISGFNHFADSVSAKFKGREDYPLAELMDRYSRTNDSLRKFHPIDATKFRSVNYMASALNPSVAITVSRMKSDVMENGYLAMYGHIDVTAGNSIFDDFSSPYTRVITTTGTSHTFSIHYRAGQEFPDRAIRLDTILYNGKIVNQKKRLHSDDILCIVNTESLPKGNYVVKGHVRAITNGKIDVRPFVHRFQME